MSDIIEPIFDPNRGWREWLISEIYTGTGTGQYVPNVDDKVWDWKEGTLRVSNVDQTTGLSTLTPWTAPTSVTTDLQVDVLLGTGPGEISESYRALLDTSVVPYVLALDSRLHVYSSASSHIKIFSGVDIGTNGKVVSAFYDNTGGFLGENIPLELVAMPDRNNISIKAPMVGNTAQKMLDGDVVTVVLYDALGTPLSTAKLIVKNTSFIRSTDASMRYITGISLKSPFISDSDPNVLAYPINLTISSVAMVGVVSYSDGTKQEMAIDGTKFSIFGLENYIATILGQKIPLILTYKLGANEYCYNIPNSTSGRITATYHATTTKVDGTYAVKLFAYPVWISATQGYRLEYFLYNLDRDQVYYVTPYVELGSTSAPFNPLAYGTVQTLDVAIDLNKVDGKFDAYRHAQAFQVTLLKPGTEVTDNWIVDYNSGSGVKYGVGVAANMHLNSVNNWTLDLTCGAQSEAEWLNIVYNNLSPIYDSTSEAAPPVPNYFNLVVGSNRYEYPVSMWSATIAVTSGLTQGQNIYLEFFRRTPVTDLQLACAGLPVHMV